jgi:hypothetical protein
MPRLVAEVIRINPFRMPRDAQMARLFEARRADTGQPWSRHKRKLSGFDLVFAPHKSVSLAAEFAATSAESAAIWNAVDRATDRAMRYVAHVLGHARRGHGGREGTEPGAVGWISFRHHTARPTLPIQDGPGGETYLFDAPVAGDPHMHIHNFLMNLVVTADGRVGSLDSQALTEIRAKEFGAYFQAILAEELRRLGVRIGYNPEEQAVVALAIPDGVCKAFSKGRQHILTKAKAFVKTQGLDWDALPADAKMDILRDAGAEGRLGKIKADEKQIWREQAEALGWQHRTVMEGIVHERLSDAERFDRAYEFAARHLAQEFHTAAVIDHETLGLYAARGLIGTGIAGGPDDIKRVVELLEERGIKLKGEHVALVVGLFDGKLRAANTAQIRIEHSLAETAKTTARDKSGALPVRAIEAAIGATGVEFTAEQRAAIYALSQGGGLTMLTGVAGAGKTTLLEALVTAWHADTRFSARGRDVIGSALAWRQADALEDAGIRRTYALTPLLRMIESGEFEATRNTVLVLDEVSQIGPRPLLKLLELQARTGMTVKMLGDREQAQAIEAGDAIEILRRALAPEALPELLTTMRQATKRGREIAGQFRDGEAATALAMKRTDGHAMLIGGDYDQVVARIADLYIARRDVLMSSGAKDGITVSAPTNDDVAAISRAIRDRLKERGELGNDETVYRAIDQDNRTYDLPIATGDRLRLFRRTWGTVDGHEQRIGDNGDIVTVLGFTANGLRLRTKEGRAAAVEWRRFADDATGRVLLGFGHALTINAAQGITSKEHINALPRGTSGVTAFTTYSAESRSRGVTWTMISEAALFEAERYRQALGDITPITQEDLWARAAADMSRKPYKTLAVDLLAAALKDRERGVDTFIACQHMLETAQLDNPNFGRDAFRYLRSQMINARLAPHLPGLAREAAKTDELIRAIHHDEEAQRSAPEITRPAPSTGPGP